ncbi:predicted protein, partial [Nematostella vectensis]
SVFPKQLLSPELKTESQYTTLKWYNKDSEKSISKVIQDSEKSISKEIRDLEQSVREEVIRSIHEVCQKLDDVTNKDLDEAERVEFAKQEKVVNRWRSCLIEEYTSKDASQITPLPWLEFEPHFSLEKMYKEPNITAKDGSKVEIRKLFESGPRRKTGRVLLEGNPGVGKTSFCKKLVNSWALLQNSEPC